MRCGEAATADDPVASFGVVAHDTSDPGFESDFDSGDNDDDNDRSVQKMK